MEDMLSLREILLSGDIMCKVDLRDVYFAVSCPRTPRHMSGSNRKTFYTNFYAYALDCLQPERFPPN